MSQPTGRIDHKGASHQVVVNGTFHGCSTDQTLAERHLQNVLTRLAGHEPATVTMTVEQFFQEHTVRDPDLPAGYRRALKSLTYGRESIFALAPARHQGFFNLFRFDGDHSLSARHCDIVEVTR